MGPATMGDKTSKESIIVSLPSPLYEALLKLSKETDRELSEILNIAAKEFLDELIDDT